MSKGDRIWIEVVSELQLQFWRVIEINLTVVLRLTSMAKGEFVAILVLELMSIGSW